MAHCLELTQLVDHGKSHASKDFYDPTTKRRILWLWGSLTSGIQAVPREVTYHPGLKRVMYAPVAEMAALHTAQIDAASGKRIGAGSPLELKVSPNCDIQLTFAMPAAAAA